MNSQAARNLSNRLPFSRALHFGLRWQAWRDTALGTDIAKISIASRPAKAPSPLCSAPRPP
jgi:hypothetical protein